MGNELRFAVWLRVEMPIGRDVARNVSRATMTMTHLAAITANVFSHRCRD
jgi:hypothetical protein